MSVYVCVLLAVSVCMFGIILILYSITFIVSGIFLHCLKAVVSTYTYISIFKVLFHFSDRLLIFFYNSELKLQVITHILLSLSH